MRKKVQIPATQQHNGYHKMTVEVDWVCPRCGKPRGEVYRTHSFDGSRRLNVDGWRNPCGHIDLYADVRQEAAT